MQAGSSVLFTDDLPFFVPLNIERGQRALIGREIRLAQKRARGVIAKEEKRKKRCRGTAQEIRNGARVRYRMQMRKEEERKEGRKEVGKGWLGRGKQ